MEFVKPLKIYGAKLKDKEKRLQSQSGGAFTAIAEYFLNINAVVYGCSLDEKQNAIYSRISDIDDLKIIKGSKYVQANMGDTFANVLDDLKTGKKVLFSGTPCYVAACKKIASLLKCEENLYTIDIICHGVPSPLVLDKYLREKSNKEKSNITNFIFRDNSSDHSNERIIYENGKEEISDDYIKLYYTNLSLRPSCGNCKYARIERVSDFTVGDFWGVQNSYPDFYDIYGVSIIYCMSKRSIDIFERIKDDFEMIEPNEKYAIQPNLMCPSRIPIYRDLFWKDIKRIGVLDCSKKWVHIAGIRQIVKGKIKRIINRK